MTEHFGHFIIDNRACGGYNTPGAVKEGDLMGCHHCGAQVVRNPERQAANPRHYCWKCGGGFICDTCAYIAAQPGYVHISKMELKDLVMSGKAVIVGGDWQRPKLLFL